MLASTKKALHFSEIIKAVVSSTTLRNVVATSTSADQRGAEFIPLSMMKKKALLSMIFVMLRIRLLKEKKIQEAEK